MPKGKRGPRPEPEPEKPPVGDSSNQPLPQPIQAAQPVREAVEPPAKGTRRVSFPVDEAGRIQWDTMRLTSKDELIQTIKGALTDPEVKKQMGLAELPQVEIFSPEWTGTIYDALGFVENFLAQKIYGLSPERAKQVFTYSEAEKAMLGKPTAKVINKWAAQYDWLVRFKEEIALAMILGSITTIKFQMARGMAEAEKAAKQKANGAEREPARVVEPEMVAVQ